MSYIVEFSEPAAVQRAVAGGKGAHLASLTTAGFTVPPGFVVTVDAFDAGVTRNIGADVEKILAGTDFADADAVEEAAAKVRALVTDLDVPADIASAITAAYNKLGSDAAVAVRSSGTAEDMAEASFAGQYDTYLDVVGTTAVLDAVKRCWASLYTTRAVAYRSGKELDTSTVKLAVVVQEMVEAEVSGVMFTANPFTTATDELVINASWGLGEGIVSGILTPDQFTLDKADLTVRDVTIGPKEVRVVRNPETGQGTVTLDNDEASRARRTLDDAALVRLGDIGRRIEEHFDSLPQDVEWAYADDTFYVLQSRAVTGVDFTWDDDVDAWQWSRPHADTIWTRGFADEYWTGAITPLFYSVRGAEQTSSYQRSAKLWGADRLAALPQFKYHKAEVYFNVENQEEFLRYTCPPMFRAAASGYLPPSRAAAVAEDPFSWAGYAKIHARILGLDITQSFHKWIASVEDYMQNRIEEADGLGDEELRKLTDRALQKYIDDRMEFVEGLLYNMWSGFQIHASLVLNGLGTLLAKWYDGDNQMIFVDLITGLPQRTITLQENLDLWDLAAEIRRSPALRKLFEQSEPHEFFDKLAVHPDGAEAHRRYQQLLKDHGHRGHADRDFIFPRRIEDPSIDYRSLQALLSGDGMQRPDEQERKQAAKREAATADVIARLEAKPFGRLRADLFRMLLDYAHRFMVLRDDERHYVDRATMSKKRAFLELGRRLLARDLIERLDDVYFLTKDELYELMAERAPQALVRAKIAGRRKQFEAFDRKDAIPPMYLQHGREWIDPTEISGGDVDPRALQGLPTSPGTVEGRARVVRELDGIGCLEKGDILITNSTDPGWTPVFAIIGGLILETGGMLAHGSCLSREYGLPAVTVANACSHIADGAHIRVDGHTGMVSVLDDELAAAR